MRNVLYTTFGGFIGLVSCLLVLPFINFQMDQIIFPERVLGFYGFEIAFRYPFYALLGIGTGTVLAMIGLGLIRKAAWTSIVTGFSVMMLSLIFVCLTADPFLWGRLVPDFALLTSLTMPWSLAMMAIGFVLLRRERRVKL